MPQRVENRYVCYLRVGDVERSIFVHIKIGIYAHINVIALMVKGWCRGGEPQNILSFEEKCDFIRSILQIVEEVVWY